MRVLLKLRSEQVEGAADQPGGTVGMAAGAPAVNLVETAPQRAQIRGAAAGQAFNSIGDRVQAEKARTALPGRLVSEVTRNPSGLPEPTHVGGQCRDQAGPTPAPRSSRPAEENGRRAALTVLTQLPK